MPKLSRQQRAALEKLAAEGPPTEEVGLEPFAPPEFMPEPAAGWGATPAAAGASMPPGAARR